MTAEPHAGGSGGPHHTEGAPKTRKITKVNRIGGHAEHTLFEGGAWSLVTHQPAAFRRALGDGLWPALCRCFIAVDRLNSLAHLNTLNHEGVRPSSPVAAARNNSTLFYLSCGTLRELGKALEALRRGGIEGRLTGEGLSAWGRLASLVKRWNTDPAYTRVRDKIGFHFDDAEMLKAGTKSIEDALDSLVLAEGDGEKQSQLRFPFGEVVLVRGLWPELRDATTTRDAFAEQIAEDQVAVQVALHEVLIDLLKNCAIDGDPGRAGSDTPVAS